jgi:hypothetical protein
MPENFTGGIAGLAAGLFLAVLLLLEVGRRIGHRRLKREGDTVFGGIGSLDGAVLGLLGLLVAFSFSGAASRFDARRQLVVQEANAIGTAYLRVDLLAAPAQPAVRASFRRYLDSRLEVYRRLPDVEAARDELRRSADLQAQLWALAVAACGQAGSSSDACRLLLPALNEMIDITTTRTGAAGIHPPRVIFAMLVVTALTSALLAGYGLAAGRTRKSLHMVAFAAVIAVAVYVIVDLEYPRLGLIRADNLDPLLGEVRDGMR